MSEPTLSLRGDNPSALPPGTRLGEFEVLRLLGVGGFGIVYLAFDHALEREVAVKEYMPAALAGRTETLQVSVRSQSDADTFALGLRSFVNEARLLARFDDPSLLKVHRFWEANGTAYMAMPVMRGRTVKELRAEMTQPPDEAWLRALLGPLLGAIEKLHSAGVYHRDIAPDNIQIEPDGHPVLLDFGAARRVISDKSQTLTAILKPAYAPIEQYGEAGAVKQGPWTDIYALGATLHYLLLNHPPPPATARALHDDASALTTEACPGCSENFLRTIDWMLAPRPIDRPQSVAALREVLDGHASPPRRRVEAQPAASQWERTVVLDAAQATTTIATRTVPPAAPDAEDDDRTRVLPPPVSAPSPKTAPTTPSATTPMPPAPPTAPTATAAAAPPLAPLDFAAPPVSMREPTAAVPAARRPNWLMPAAGAAVVVAAVAGWALWPRSPAPVRTDAAPVAASAPLAAASVAMPESPPAAPAASAVPESAVTTVVVPSRPSAPASQPPAPAADKPAAVKPQAPPRPPVTKAQPPAVPTPVPATAPAPDPARAATPALPPPTANAPPAGNAPPVAAPADAGKPAVATGPEAKCGNRNPLRYFVCMERECLRSELASHPDCLKWRAEARREPRN